MTVSTRSSRSSRGHGRELEGRAIWHFNSTARGGGVAEMLRSYLAYVRGAGVDVRWMVAGGDARFFEVTKRLHNNLHGDPGDGGALGEAERRVYQSTLADATGELAHLVRRGDIVFLHDPQTAGMVRPVRELGASVVWRCHVGVDRPNELVRGAWDFLRPELDGADALVFSRAALRLGRARRTADLDHAADHRRLLSEEPGDGCRDRRLGAGHDRARPGRFPAPADYQRNDGAPARVNRKATIVQEDRLPAEAPLVAQVSRWDRLKDPVGLLVCFAEHVTDASLALGHSGAGCRGCRRRSRGRRSSGRGARRASRRCPTPFAGGSTWSACRWTTSTRTRRWSTRCSAARTSLSRRASPRGLDSPSPRRCGSRSRWWPGVGGIQDQIVDGESGLLVDDPRDLAAVAAAIDSLLADPGAGGADRSCGPAAGDRRVPPDPPPAGVLRAHRGAARGRARSLSGWRSSRISASRRY